MTAVEIRKHQNYYRRVFPLPTSCLVQDSGNSDSSKNILHYASSTDSLLDNINTAVHGADMSRFVMMLKAYFYLITQNPDHLLNIYILLCIYVTFGSKQFESSTNTQLAFSHLQFKKSCSPAL